MHPLEVELLRRAEKSYYPYDPYWGTFYFSGCSEEEIKKFFSPLILRLNTLLKDIGATRFVDTPSFERSDVIARIAPQLRDAIHSSPISENLSVMSRDQLFRAFTLSEQGLLTREAAARIAVDEDLFSTHVKRFFLGLIRRFWVPSAANKESDRNG